LGTTTAKRSRRMTGMSFFIGFCQNRSLPPPSGLPA
jgi:hypothetical protein